MSEQRSTNTFILIYELKQIYEHNIAKNFISDSVEVYYIFIDTDFENKLLRDMGIESHKDNNSCFFNRLIPRGFGCRGMLEIKLLHSFSFITLFFSTFSSVNSFLY